MSELEIHTHTGDRYPQILVDILVAAPLPRQFTYNWPRKAVRPVRGMRVIVPWGKRFRVGVVYQQALTQLPDSRIKDVIQVLDDGQLLGANWFELMTFCANYYQYPLGLICLESLPKALKTLSAKNTEPVMVARGLKKVQQWADDTRKPDANVIRPALTAEQKSAVEAMDLQSGFATHLLFGVTGAGKTEVYLHLIEKVLALGKQALVLLPEINLTPSAMALYESRLKGYNLKVLHSKLAETQRTQHWLAAALGVADVVIGTRLGVLTPMPRLGLIVVDEEHDPSYKQQEGMKYQARDVAVVRGKQLSIPVLLGSATPSLESWQRTLAGHYKRLDITQRAVNAAKLPEIEIIDTQKLPMHEGLSEPVMLAIKQTVAEGQQVLVFLNRRGYAPQLACDACGWVAGCKHCSAHLVWHKRDRSLRCHHCGAGLHVPRCCPDCGNQDLAAFGRGTQRVEEALIRCFPECNLIRIDADSTRQKGQMETLLEEAHSGRADILVGTQMIAKGHDFANIGLVVALNVDMSLYSHSFRAPERLFAQLMQVAGRAGRRQNSAKVMIQSRYPDHPLFGALKAHNYECFATAELENRRAARMPPFAYQATLRADHKHIAQCLAFLAEAKRLGENLLPEGGVYFCDPVPLTMTRVADVERAQMLIESEHRPALQQFLTNWLASLYEQKTSVKWFIEVDPSDI